jgi:hypothetical protein
MEKGMTALLSKRMMSVVGFTIAFAVGGSISARAERRIGVASAVQPVVEQVGAPTEDEIKTGDPIFMNEAIKTGPISAATIAFTDDAHLTINSGSRTVLSSFIFADAKRYSTATFHLAKGSFRFAPGRSESRAYIFKTPTAVLTVRDASFDVAVTEQKTVVRVGSGAVELCRRGAGEASLLRKGAADDVRDRNVIAFTKAPPFVPKEDGCRRGPLCSVIGAGESGTMTGDDGCIAGDVVMTQVYPPVMTTPIVTPYLPSPPATDLH